MSLVLLDKKYNWEDSYDLQRDVEEAVMSVADEQGDEFPGKISVIITYNEEDD